MNQWFVNEEDLPEGIVAFNELTCGCGQPGLCWGALHNYLKETENYVSTEDPFKLFFMYVVDHLGFTEHGSSIYGAWKTEKGKQILEWLNNNIEKVENLIICYP